MSGVTQRMLLVFAILTCAMSPLEATSRLATRHLRHSEAKVRVLEKTRVPAEARDEEDDDDDEADDVAAPATNSTDKEALQAGVRAAHSALADNLKRQVELNVEIKELDDGAKSDREIEASQKAVANETQSPAVATFLADMWKEMRMFAKPFYKEHLEEKLGALEGKTPALQAEFTRSKAALSAWTPPMPPVTPASAPAAPLAPVAAPAQSVASSATPAAPVAAVATSAATEDNDEDDDSDDDSD
eukprot:TRINITY_DN56492_c0_g1_i1.p1 TRINITY_DN56492_c0_g1~~TRINITY_DN56492_c0_g1_i1.p1  ORF type:complete len:245 (-),score=74.80 TRINITY_DN56492_c0_g1_i1:47-781(-)